MLAQLIVMLIYRKSKKKFTRKIKLYKNIPSNTLLLHKNMIIYNSYGILCDK